MIPLGRRLDQVGFSVRADWPDGTHDIFGWRRNWYTAWRPAAPSIRAVDGRDERSQLRAGGRRQGTAHA